MNAIVQQLLDSPAVGAIVSMAVAFVADKVSSWVGRYLQFRKDSWQEKLFGFFSMSIRRAYLTEEGITTGEVNKTGLPLMDSIQAVKSVAGKLTPEQGRQALSLAAGIAQNLAEENGVDLIQEMGGLENVKAGLQDVFDEIKRAK
jgi:hypothetical protein